MEFRKQLLYFLLVIGLFATACSSSAPKEDVGQKVNLLKGLYSYGPEIKSFINCEEGREYWVLDSAKTLELAYQEIGLEKPYTPVYIEVECFIKKSDTSSVTGDYDSTMVVTKLLKISKEIPEGPCNQ